MAIVKQERPSDEALERFIVRDGYLWWNPNADLPQSNRRIFDEPIGIHRKQKYPTIFFDGVMHHVHRINYLMHTGEWPEILDTIDDSKTSLHIDNIKPSNMSDIFPKDLDRKGKRAPYYIREYKLKSGKIKYNVTTYCGGKIRKVGGYMDKEKAIEAGESIYWIMNHQGRLPDSMKRYLNCKAVYR